MPSLEFLTRIFVRHAHQRPGRHLATKEGSRFQRRQLVTGIPGFTLRWATLWTFLLLGPICAYGKQPSWRMIALAGVLSAPVVMLQNWSINSPKRNKQTQHENTM